MTPLSKFERKQGRHAPMNDAPLADLKIRGGRLKAYRTAGGGATVTRIRSRYTRTGVMGRLHLAWLLSESPDAGAPELGYIGERLTCKVFQVARAFGRRFAPALAIGFAIGWTLLTHILL